jgi:hypothetical protein
MVDKEPGKTFSDEYETEGIAEDGYLGVIAKRLQRIGAPAVEVVRESNRKLIIGAAIGGTVSLAAGMALAYHR